MGYGSVVSGGEWGSGGGRGDADRERAVGFGLLVGPATVLLAYHVHFLFAGSTNDLRRAVAWVAPVVLVGVVAYALLWIDVEDDRHAEAPRVGTWCLAGTVAFGAAAGLLVALQAELGGRVVATGFSVAAWASAGTVAGTLLGVYDAGGRIALERERAAREEAEDLNRRLSVLDRVLRHHLRNDLNLVEGNARILLDAGTSDPERVGEIRSVSGDLLEMSETTRAVRTVLKDGTGGRSTVDVADLAREHVSRLDEAHPEVGFEASLPDSAEALAHELVADAVREVIDNAVEHNDGPRQRVTVDVETDDGRIELRVADDGPGIPERELELVETARETRPLHGHGLGLWVTATAVRASGGDLLVEEGDPSGTVVRIRLDRAD